MRIRKPTPAMVVAIIALFAVFGGTATAAKLITGKQVKNSSLTGGDIRNSSLSGADMRDGSMTGGDIRNGSIKAADLAESAVQETAASISVPPGPVGPAGPQGAQGPAGPTGATGVARIVSVQTSGFDGTAVALCPEGSRPVSGGGIDLTPAGAIIASAAYKESGSSRIGWGVISSDIGEVVALAYCSSGVSEFVHPNGPARSASSGVLNERTVAELKAKRR